MVLATVIILKREKIWMPWRTKDKVNLDLERRHDFFFYSGAILEGFMFWMWIVWLYFLSISRLFMNIEIKYATMIMTIIFKSFFQEPIFMFVEAEYLFLESLVWDLWCFFKSLHPAKLLLNCRVVTHLLFSALPIAT